MNTKTPILILYLLMHLSLKAQIVDVSIVSPDGNIKGQISLSGGSLIWNVAYQSKPVILSSDLRITGYENNLSIKQITESTKDTIWHPIYGERSVVRDHYNRKLIRIIREANRHELLLEVRAYNEGLAFRYIFDEHPGGGTYLHITGENTSFTLPENTQAWFVDRAQGLYQLLPIKDWPGECERPLTLQLPNGLYACIAEAEVVEYTRTKFVLDRQKANTIICKPYDAVEKITPFATPWRVIMVAEKPGQLLENNDILLNLNPPCAIENPWWIRPGKVMREVTLSTKGAKELVDFAVKRNLQYIHFDAGWYGYEHVKSSDATTVTVDPRRNPKGDLDLHKAIAYAKKHGIGVFVYVNQRALYEQLDEILPLYKSWGIDGIKFGFVQVGSYRWTTWMHEAVKKCAQYGLMVDIHDEYRPTGFSRTYPNLLTQEGIRGNEEMPDAKHNTILPFTRYVAGAGDYTICYYRQKSIMDTAKEQDTFTAQGKYIKTTSAHQLALSVICYSPLQFLYWYDRPSDSRDEPELEFFDAIPTIWDDTRVLDGAPGEYVVMARRSGNEWFLVAITNNDTRKIEISLSFLPKDATYTAGIYTDDDKVKTRTKVGIEQRRVKAADKLSFQLKGSGGVAIRLFDASAGL